MGPTSSQLESVLAAAVEIKDEADRRRYIEQACGADPQLKSRVEELVANYLRAGSFLESPAAGLLATVAQPPVEGPGTVIGPYKLLQPLGEGGMGAVFMAEQTRPVQRKVAIKVIKPGMDSRQVIARFNAERQALALMDHPNIAKVLDAGTTDLGRPYFVMELVKGVPITAYCDAQRLTPRRRLELFVQVCEAVQHAHQKGVIHRDLKPSNVLVALYDGRPVPKVIDFGVAKATGGRLTDLTIFTGFGAMVGTPEYMSPEQAELNQLDVDTRSDVYSLGVLLYELLAGSTPLDRSRFKEAALAEVLRVIREEEPPRPSTRLSTTEALASIAACRSVEPRKLSGVLRGELDWIVMKALEKDRARRYETANGMAADVRRYLSDEPVQACPPSATYRVKKFVRRHKLLVGGVAALVAVLAAGAAGTTAGFLRARQQKAEAQTQQKRAEEQAAIAKAVNDFLGEMLSAADPARMLGDKVTVLQAIEEAIKKLDAGALKDQPLVEAAVRATIGNTLRALSRYDEAEPHLRGSLDVRRRHLPADHPDVTASIRGLASLLYDQGKHREAEPLVREGLASLRRTRPPDHPDITEALRNLGWVLYAQGRMQEAESLLREATGRRRTPATLNSLAVLLQSTGRVEQAVPLYREALELARAQLPPGHLGLARPASSLAMAYLTLGQLPRAEELQREALAIQRKALPAEHRDVGQAAYALARILQDERKLDEAEPLYQEALDIYRKVLPAGHLDVGRCLSMVGGLLRLRGKFEDAERLQRESLGIRRAALPAGHLEIAYGLWELALALEGLGKYGEAVPYLREALDIRQKSLPAGTPEIKRTADRLLAATQHAAGVAVVPKPPPTTKPAASSLAQLNVEAWQLRRAGKMQESVDLRKRIVEEARRVRDPELGKYLLNYGEVLEAGPRQKEAEAPYLEALTAAGDAEQASTCACRLVKLYRVLKQPEKAAEYEAKAEAVLPRQEREASTADDWLALATSHIILKHWPAAVSACGRACSLSEQAGATERFRVASRCASFSRALKDQQRPQEQASMLRLAIALRRLPDPAATPAVLLAAGNDHNDLAFLTASPEEALALVREGINLKQQAAAGAPSPANHIHLAHSYRGLAMLLQRRPSGPATRPAEAARAEVLDALDRAAKELDFPGVPDSVEVAQFRLSIGAWFVSLGCGDEAIPLLTRARATLAAKLGPGHRETLSCVQSLARAHQSAGRHAAAISLCEEAVRLQRAERPAEHGEALGLLYSLANAHQSAGQHTAAIDLFQGAVRAQRAERPAEHLETLQLLAALARAHEQAGNVEEALSVKEEALAVRRDASGPDDAKTLQAANLLGVELWRAGKLDRSIPLYEDLLRRRLANAGKDHPDTIRAMANLGVNYASANRLGEAIPRLEEALELARKSEGFNLDWVLTALADAYSRDGRHAKAGPLYQELSDRAAQNFGPGDLRTNAARVVVALNLLRRKKYADAEPLLREGLRIREEREPDAWATFNTKSMLGESLLGQRRYDEAAPLLLAGYAGMKERDAQIPPQVRALRLREGLERLVQLYNASGNPEEAARWRKQLDAHEQANPSQRIATPSTRVSSSAMRPVSR